MNKFIKNKDFFLGFKIRTYCLGVNNTSILVFKYLFIHKIFVHPKKSGKRSEKIPKIQKNLKNPKNMKKFT